MVVYVLKIIVVTEELSVTNR